MFDLNSDPFVAPFCHQSIDILFEDDDILLINKPSGLLSLSGKNPLNKDSVHYRLCQIYPTIRMLHRLDFGTSGIMLLAKNKTSNTLLMKQFQARTIQKEYLAILQGVVTENSVIDLPIAKGTFPTQKICVESGKLAQSQLFVIDVDAANNCSRVKLVPLTGRTHQLRIHCKEIGHPILGCDLYYIDNSESKANRLLLHAHKLSFHHPSTNERLEVECECPF
jgi:tRNA pseudouridine32 synthase/23S rRNA pseudouridine746 synthase